MSLLDVARAPDLTEAIEVWRAWRVVEHGDGLVLASVLNTTVWPPYEPLVAQCLRSETWPRRLLRRPAPRHGAPSEPCECGIYGADLARVGQYLAPPPSEGTVARVLGRVSLWGIVVECERGFRASHAYPAQIYIPADASPRGDPRHDLATALASYGVPVELLSERCSEVHTMLAHGPDRT